MARIHTSMPHILAIGLLLLAVAAPTHAWDPFPDPLIWSALDSSPLFGALVDYTQTSGLEIGRTTLGQLYITGGKTLTTANGVMLGVSATGTGQVYINDGQWTSELNTYAGTNGSAVVIISDGCTWRSNAYTAVGSQATSNGSVAIYGQWSAYGETRIGDLGTGVVTVYAGAAYSEMYTREDCYLGHGATGHGTVTIDNGRWSTSAGDDLASKARIGHGGTGIVNINNNGDWDTSGDVFVGSSGGTGTVNINNGDWVADESVLIGSGGTGTVNVYPLGELTVNRCQFYDNPFKNRVSIGSSGTLNIEGGTVDIDVELDNDGTINMTAGALTIGGYTIWSAGTLSMRLGGAAPGVGYGQVTVTDYLHRGGTLDVDWRDSFEASAGDTFQLFIRETGATMVQTFSSVELPPFSHPLLRWNTNSLYTTGTISVTSLPPGPGDADSDGDVDLDDFVILKLNFGAAAATGSL